MNYTDDRVKKIMVVDDEDDLIFLLRTLLDQIGFKVSGFTDPLLALQAFKAGTYDLAILDIRLPGLDGFELYERLKRIDNSLKVCFFTASEFYYKNSKEEQHSILINEHPIIRKPISNEDLIKQVQKVLELK
jgi:DNA-binding response OmpR family regulator